MPGLFGVIGPWHASSGNDAQELATIVRRMATAMRYDESYVETLVACPAVGAYVGSVAFADASPAAAPTCAERPIVLVTGEAAPQPQGRDMVGEGADPCRREGRSGWLPGEEIVRGIAGKYAAFISDPSSGRCFLCNDRYGRERIFLHRNGSRTFFSSEAKAILAVAPGTRAFDPVGLAEFMACGCTLGSRSLYRDIEVLEPGTVVTFDRSGVQGRRRWWTAEELEGQEPLDATQFVERFSELLRTAVNTVVKDSPPAGISLTGGLDSRMIMASLQAPPGTVLCYTFGSMYRTSGDVAVARQVAAACGQPHHVIELGGEFLRNLPENLERSVYISDGYLGLSGAAELYLNRKARSIAPARMTGNWGGELMRGVRAFKDGAPKCDFIIPELVEHIKESALAFSTKNWHPVSAALFQQMPFQGYGRYAVERSQLVMRSPFLADDVVRSLYRAPASVRESTPCAAVVIGRKPELLAIPTDLGLLGTGSSAIRRASRRVLVKAEYLTSHGAPDWLARLSARLPASLLETRFLGVDKFQHFRFWTRHELAGWVRETLRDEEDGDLRAWFDMPRVARMVDDHIQGRANHTDAIDKLLTVAVANRTLLRADLGTRVSLPTEWDANGTT